MPLPGSDVDGRLYALGQMLAHEQERSVRLQKQLEERITEVDRLHNDVEQLQARQTELQAAFQNAAAAPGQEAGIAMARRKRGDPAPEAAQVQQAALRDVANDSAIAARAEAEAAAQAAQAQAAQAQTALASARAALVEEQHRREQTEAELARLKQETSAPPYEQPAGSDNDAAAAKQEVADLRAALETERSARERLAHEFEALQQQAATANATIPPENNELEAELKRLRDEKQAVSDSFARSLAESQKRAADLEQQLALALAAAAAPAAQAAPANTAEVSSMRAENAALRSRLDEEHRRTAELAAKLKIAARVTDLIFKMQAQQAQAQPLRPR